MGEVVDTVGKGVAFDFLVDGEGALLVVVVELHLGGVEAGLAADVVAELGVFDNHLGEEGVPGKAEEVVAVVGRDLDDDIGPAGEDVASTLDFVVGESMLDDLV